MVGVRGGCPEGARCPRSQVEELRRFVRCAPRFFVLAPARRAPRLVLRSTYFQRHARGTPPQCLPRGREARWVTSSGADTAQTAVLLLTHHMLSHYANTRLDSHRRDEASWSLINRHGLSPRPLAAARDDVPAEMSAADAPAKRADGPVHPSLITFTTRRVDDLGTSPVAPSGRRDTPPRTSR